MSTIQIASYVVATALALSRLLEVAKPFWMLLPGWLAAFIPSVVAMLPVAVASFSTVKTEMDFVSAILVAGALLLPGARPKADPEPDEEVSSTDGPVPPIVR